jgi:Cu(I)/Ag(I) efflux system membrane fusion protein
MKTILAALLTILIAFSVQAQHNQTHSHSEHLETLVEEYLNMKTSLTSDDLESAQTHLQAFSDEVKNSSEMNDHQEHSEQHDMHHGAMKEAVQQAEQADDIEAFRLAFKEISEQLLTALENQGYEGDLYKQYCPMYEDGSNWISDSEEIENPFYGSQMHNCGETVERIDS